MKKLLSLLSVLTISGSAIPTTIAASPYQKEEIKLENREINSLQTNNLENLKRNKREELLSNYEGAGALIKIDKNTFNYNTEVTFVDRIVETKEEKYFYNTINITNLFGYKSWNEVPFKFINFFGNNLVDFEIIKNNSDNKKISEQININDINISKTTKYTGSNLDGVNSPSFTNVKPNGSGMINYTGQDGKSLAFNDYSNLVFDKTLFNNTIKLKISADRYKDNEDLILRIIYKIERNSSIFSVSNYKINVNLQINNQIYLKK